MSEGSTRSAERLARELLSRSLTISIAESCTGGMAAGTLTDVAGISGSFKLGIVAYSDGAKVGVLGLDGEMLAANGAVSGETAAAMGARIWLESEEGHGSTFHVTFPKERDSSVAGPGLQDVAANRKVAAQG